MNALRVPADLTLATCRPALLRTIVRFHRIMVNPVSALATLLWAMLQVVLKSFVTAKSKRAAISTSAVFLVVFFVIHGLGNLTALVSGDTLNRYGHHLHTFGGGKVVHPCEALLVCRSPIANPLALLPATPVPSHPYPLTSALPLTPGHLRCRSLLGSGIPLARLGGNSADDFGEEGAAGLKVLVDAGAACDLRCTLLRLRGTARCNLPYAQPGSNLELAALCAPCSLLLAPCSLHFAPCSLSAAALYSLRPLL